MARRKSILYVQHATTIGGSVISLKEVVTDALSHGYDCSVICESGDVARFYSSLGAKTYHAYVVPFNHNTALNYGISLLNILRIVKLLLKTVMSFFQFIRIVIKAKPSIAHVNSSALFLYLPYFRCFGISTVFHVRENVVEGYFGIRRALIRSTANMFANAIIYISEHEYDLLRTVPEKSYVIYNYVHLEAFVRNIPISRNDVGPLKLITLGGLYRLKGGDVLLESLRKVNTNVELTILGGEDPFTRTDALSYIDGDVYTSRIMDLLNDEKIRSKIRIVGKVGDAAPYIAGSDALVFWARAPHFPRPVFEAWLFRKPVVYFNPGFQNELIDGGNICPVADVSPESLAHAIDSLPNSPQMSDEKKNLSEAAAIENFTERNFEKINALYEKLLEA